MRIWNKVTFKLGCLGAFSAALLVFSSCGGGGSSSNNPRPTPVTNTVPVEVKAGPGAFPFPNALYTSVTICVPGSTTNCQTIDNIQVDTGSYGLRLLDTTVATLNLPKVTDNSSNVLQECVQFADLTYVWGPVATADIQMAGEKGSSVPIQLIASSPTINPPADCTSGAPANGDLNTVDALGAKGIIGLGVFQQDCGGGCTTGSFFSGYPYYLCPGGACSPAAVPALTQVQNPAWTFPQDYNGLLITLPAVPDTGSPTLAGSMIFGIGTQTDNALGGAQIYTTDVTGNFRTTYNGTQYGAGGLIGSSSNLSFIDSGSNGLYILDPATLGNGILECPDNPGFYCPALVTTLTAQNMGLNGTAGSVSFKIGNADTLLATGDAALGGLAGDNFDSFDWGLPFFYGRTVFVGIENETGPGGVVGPYWAY
jgi:Protein of unknown function (DUF3443)